MRGSDLLFIRSVLLIFTSILSSQRFLLPVHFYKRLFSEYAFTVEDGRIHKTRTRRKETNNHSSISSAYPE